ncbi:hypothetical protein Daus18300_009888 [Diaporthe australafricana]|uniref:Apple domain-containing protein n=1 Tax=Diaporthe australafricana TaxID=127596 RepID=A0ABR3WCE3_9PEZI
MDRDQRHQGGSSPVSPYSDAPEVVQHYDPPQVVPDTGQTPQVFDRSDELPTYMDGPHYIETASPEPDKSAAYGQHENRDLVCGLRPRIFWPLAIGTILLIGAAVGGGVGGVLATRQVAATSSTSISPSEAAATTASPTTSPTASLTTSPTTTATSSSLQSTTTTTPTTTKSTSSSGTKTAIYGPSGSVIYRDCPASDDTMYTSSEEPSWQWRKFCDNTTFVSAKVGQQWVNTFAVDLDACVDMCVKSSVDRESAIAAGEQDPCNAVCWRNGFENDDYPGQCFGFTTANSTATGEFQFKDDWRCDSAGWINQGTG